MADVEAVAVLAVEGSEVTDDGRHMLLGLALQDGKSTLAIPVEKIPDLMQMLSTASGQSAKILKQAPNVKHVLPVDWWEAGQTADGSLVLAFRLPGGAQQAFQIHQNNIAAIRDALSAMLGEGLPGLPSGTPKN